MAFLHDDLMDLLLDALSTDGTRLDLCSAEPTTYTEATSTYTRGNKTSITYNAPANGDTSGRKVMTVAITGLVGTSTGNATHWAITDPVGSKLLATGPLASSPVAITTSSTYSIASFKALEIEDPA